MPKKKKTYLQKSWLDQEQYKDWLAEAPEDTNVLGPPLRSLLSLLQVDQVVQVVQQWHQILVISQPQVQVLAKFCHSN